MGNRVKIGFLPLLVGERIVEAELFAAALGLQALWYVSDLNFSLENKELNINIDFESGSLFFCPVWSDLFY